MPDTVSPTGPEDTMRGVAGALILGVPLIYTQEVWTHGGSLSPVTILGLLVTSFALNLALTNFVGFRSGRIQRPVEDAVVGFGLSFVLATLLLALLNRVDLDTGWGPNLGVIAISAVPFSLGFALGNAMAPQEGSAGSNDNDPSSGMGDVLAAAAGALLLALNIAPTEEPLLLAAELGWIRLVLLVLLAVALSYLMVFYAEFHGKGRRRTPGHAIQKPWVETMLCYVVSLAMTALMLMAFGAIDAPDGATLARVVTLGFPASLGSALGRLLV